jgi:hypothetical protein
MCVFAALAMTLVHPGIHFKAMSSRVREQQSQIEKNDGIENNDGRFFSFPGIRNIKMLRGIR